MRNRVGRVAKLLLLLTVFTSYMSNATETEKSNEKIEAVDASKSPSNTENKSNEDEDVEVIGVVGEKPLAFFRKQMEIAELDFYDLFNELAEEEKYKIKCRKERKTGSNMIKKVCYPQYVLDRFARETQEAMRSGRPFPTLEEIETLVYKERERSNAYAEKIITENPTLLKKLIALNNSQAMYEKKKAEK